MKKSLGRLSRAALIGMSVAMLAAPSALAAPPSNGPITATSEKPPDPDRPSPAERVAVFTTRAAEVVGDAKAALTAAERAETKAAARKAKDSATKVKQTAQKLYDDIQAFLEEGLKMSHDTRTAAALAVTAAADSRTAAEQAIGIANARIDQPAKNDIVTIPTVVGRGDVIVVHVSCEEGEGDNFASDAVDFIGESQFGAGGVTAIGGLVKKDAAPGSHTVSATCGTDKVSTTFKVSEAAPVEVNPPTADDVRRKGVIKPKGRIEAGGGATAQLTA